MKKESVRSTVRSKPILVSWNVTKACNLSCPHCYRDAGQKDPNELTFKQGKNLIQQIKDVGFKILVLSGGEPLLREDIFDLIKFASSLGLRVVLGSNGTLITEDTAKKLKDSGASRIGISLDSCKPESHDKFRGKQGAFQAVLNGIENCKKADLEFQIHTTAYKENIAEIIKITDLAVQLGAKAHHIFFLISTGRAKKKIKYSILHPQEESSLLRDLLKKQKETNIEIKPVCAPYFMRLAKEMNISQRFTPFRNKFLTGQAKGCLAGMSYCVITPTGVVQPCPYLPMDLGNVRADSFLDIWNKNEVLSNLRKNKLKGRCGNCRYNIICGGCRAKAYAFTGDYLGEDPTCKGLSFGVRHQRESLAI